MYRNRHRIARLRAFTLIELLAAITILMVIVSVMGIIFAETDRAWHLGTGRVESNTEARAALNLLSHDLQYALADSLLTFAMREDYSVRSIDSVSFGYTNSEACFVSLHQESEDSSSRSSRELYYWVMEKTDNGNIGGTRLHRYQLMRTAIESATTANNAYDDPLWYGAIGQNSDRHSSLKRAVVADNVTAFGLFAPDDLGAMTREYYSDDLANSNRLPQYVDVYLEVLSDKDAIQAADLKQRFGAMDSRTLDFVERNSRRYTTRVHFQNRSGYKTRL